MEKKSTIASLIEGLEAASSRFLPPSASHYNVSVRSRSLAFGLITLTLIFAACRGNAQAAPVAIRLHRDLLRELARWRQHQDARRSDAMAARNSASR